VANILAKLGAPSRAAAVSIAYQAFGDGPVDLVVVRGSLSDLSSIWEQPLFVRHAEGLAKFARVLMFDKRGMGLSDRLREVSTLEDRMDDIRAVLDDAKVERAAFFAAHERDAAGADLCSRHDPEPDKSSEDRRDAARYENLLEFANAGVAPKAPIHPKVVENEEADWTGEKNVRKNHPQVGADRCEVFEPDSGTRLLVRRQGT